MQIFDQVIYQPWVGDRAMMSKENVAQLEAQGYQYIIAAKLKTLSKPLQSSMLNAAHYPPR